MERLDKVLANLGLGSRKEVKELIKAELVSIDNKIIKDPAYKIANNTIIYIDNKEYIYKEYVYYLLNKPAGYLSATESNNYPTVLELLPKRNDLFLVGRLDLDTEGMLIITNDGKFSHNLINPKKEVEKEYYFKYDGILVSDAVKRCQEGININNEYITKPAILNIYNKEEGTITITEGKYHEVKRMIKALGGEVTYLKRFRIANYSLPDDLKAGEYRELNEEDLKNLNFK